MLVRVADVAVEPVSFLWDPYLPLGKLSLIGGDPGIGKTFLVLAVTAAVTKGRALPGGASRKPANVLYMTAEDGIADTLRPRLGRSDADLERVVVLDGAHGADGTLIEVTLADVELLDAALEAVKPALAIVDPLQGFLGSDVDMHRANETRPVLRGLARLAAKHGCAIVAVQHLRKSAADRAVYRGLGSIDLAAAARSILLVAEDPEDPIRRVLAHVKSNLALRGESRLYEIRDGRVEWLGPSSLGAEALLAAPASDAAPRPRDMAAEWLAAELAFGPVPVGHLRELAQEAGIAWRTIQRARQTLGVRAERVGGIASAGRWEWRASAPKNATAPSRERGGVRATGRVAGDSGSCEPEVGALSTVNGRDFEARLDIEPVQGVSIYVVDDDPDGRVWELRRNGEVLAGTEPDDFGTANAWIAALQSGELPAEARP